MSLEAHTKSSRRIWGLLLAVFFVGLLLRLPGLADRGPWLDERMSLTIAMGSSQKSPLASAERPFTPRDLWAGSDWRNVARVNQTDNVGNNLVYALLLHGWLSLFGPNDLSARSLSLLLALGTLVLTFRLGRLVAGDLVGAMAALAYAVHPLAIRYGQEVRAYGLATLLGLAATCLLLQTLQERTPGAHAWRWGVYAALSVLAFLSHWLVLPLLAGHFLLVALQRRRESWRPYLGALGLMALLLLPWFLVSGRHGFAETAAISAGYRAGAVSGDPEYWWVHPATPKYLLGGLLGASLTLAGYALPGARVALAAVALLVPAALLLLALRSGAAELRGVRPLLLLSLMGLPFALAAALRAGHDLSFQAFYFNFYVPLLAVVLATAALVCWRRQPRAALLPTGMHLALVGVSLAGTLPFVFSERRPNAYAEIARAVWAQPGVRLVELPTWADAQMVGFYLGAADTPQLRVTRNEAAGVVLRAASGAPLRALRIDRTAAH